MNVAIVHESLTGNTRRAAELMAREAESGGADVSVRPTTDLDYKALAAADLVVVGTWVDGLFFVGQRPGRAARLWQLPVIDRKKAVVYCTYAINPGKTLQKMQAIVEARGGEVLGGRALRRDRLDEGAPAFIADALALLPAT